MISSDLLDVLAAAGAARLTGRRFGFGPPAEMPAIDIEPASELCQRLRTADFIGLRMSPMDMLRGAGQMPTLDVRAARIAESLTVDDVVQWLTPIVTPRVSLRWETGNPSDTPAAYRWQGSSPIARLSHPGRNALALYAIVDLPPLHLAMFQVPPAGAWMPTHQWPFGRARQWYAPRDPISYAAWLAAQRAGPPSDDGRYPQASIPAVAGGGVWWVADIVSHGKTLSLSATRPVRAPAGAAST